MRCRVVMLTAPLAMQATPAQFILERLLQMSAEDVDRLMGHIQSYEPAPEEERLFEGCRIVDWSAGTGDTGGVIEALLGHLGRQSVRSLAGWLAVMQAEAEES